MTLRLACLALALLTLSGCGGLRNVFGLDRNPPDEFQVVQRAPLELPSQLALPPPRPGALRPQEGTTTDQAAATLFGPRSAGAAQAQGQTGGQAGGAQAAAQAGRAALTGAPAAPASGSERALLARAGADRADPTIRSEVDLAAAAEIRENRGWLDRVLWWRKPEPPGTVVDARQEAQRLRDASALGRPVTEGETPVIQRRKRAPLEGLFRRG
jgi:hypothetical protein